MHRTKLRKVGGSVMMAIPPALLEVADLRTGSDVTVSFSSGKLVIERPAKPAYTLQQLLDVSDYAGEHSGEDNSWTTDSAIGHELL